MSASNFLYFSHRRSRRVTRSCYSREIKKNNRKSSIKVCSHSKILPFMGCWSGIRSVFSSVGSSTAKALRYFLELCRHFIDARSMHTILSESWQLSLEWDCTLRESWTFRIGQIRHWLKTWQMGKFLLYKEKSTSTCLVGLSWSTPMSIPSLSCWCMPWWFFSMISSSSIRLCGSLTFTTALGTALKAKPIFTVWKWGR